MSISVMNVFRAYEVHNAPSRSAVANRLSRAEEKRDMVALSTQAKDFQMVKQMLSKTPDIRSERVEPIKAQIKADTYFVSSQMVADKILSGANSVS